MDKEANMAIDPDESRNRRFTRGPVSPQQPKGPRVFQHTGDRGRERTVEVLHRTNPRPRSRESETPRTPPR